MPLVTVNTMPVQLMRCAAVPAAGCYNNILKGVMAALFYRWLFTQEEGLRVWLLPHAAAVAWEWLRHEVRSPGGEGEGGFKEAVSGCCQACWPAAQPAWKAAPHAALSRHPATTPHLPALPLNAAAPMPPFHAA